MSCKQCVKREISAIRDATLITFLGLGIVGGIIGMIACWISSWDSYKYGEGYVEDHINWLAFIICGISTLPGIITTVYVHIPVDNEKCRPQDS